MDPNYDYNAAWDETNNAIPLNERHPINGGQTVNYSSNDYAETGVESQVDMTNGVAVTKLNAPNVVPDICEPPNLSYCAKIWKYLEQIKSISAGQWWNGAIFGCAFSLFSMALQDFCCCRAVACTWCGRFSRCSISIHQRNTVTIGNASAQGTIRMRRNAWKHYWSTLPFTTWWDYSSRWSFGTSALSSAAFWLAGICCRPFRRKTFMWVITHTHTRQSPSP